MDGYLQARLNGYLRQSAGGDEYSSNPPATDGSKVIISDTNHQDPTGADNAWVWKSFTRGLNTAVIDGRLYGRNFPRH